MTVYVLHEHLLIARDYSHVDDIGIVVALLTASAISCKHSCTSLWRALSRKAPYRTCSHASTVNPLLTFPPNFSQASNLPDLTRLLFSCLLFHAASLSRLLFVEVDASAAANTCFSVVILAWLVGSCIAHTGIFVHWYLMQLPQPHRSQDILQIHGLRL